MSSPFPPSDHCDGHRFFNPHHHVDRSWRDVWRWKRSARPAPWHPQPASPSRPPAALGDSPLAATWIGHATALLQTRAGTVLTDPVFSHRVGPFNRFGPARVRPPGIALDDLPTIDVVLLSHDHYDHCDHASLKKLWHRHAPLAITPLGNAPLLRAAGFSSAHIVELDWWQSHATPASLRITATPARHWSNRLNGPRNSRLWSGFFLRTPDASVFFAGDTAYDSVMFTDIHARLGSPDLALIPIGAYLPRWFMNEQHCDPAEAVQIHRDLRARQSLALHWGTFPLTDEGFDDPPRELEQALRNARLPPSAFLAPEPGNAIRF